MIFNTINYKILLEISGLQKDGEPAAFLQFRISAQEKFSDLNSIKVWEKNTFYKAFYMPIFFTLTSDDSSLKSYTKLFSLQLTKQDYIAVCFTVTVVNTGNLVPKLKKLKT